MIRITTRGLVKFMTASPAGQRKVVKDFKYPDEDEPLSMRTYYYDAYNLIYAFHKNSHDRRWLNDKANELMQLAVGASAAIVARCKNNSRALRQYESAFSHRKLEPISRQPKMTLEFGGVTVSVVPDLYVSEKNRTKLVKLDFSKEPNSAYVHKIVSQCMFEAALMHMESVTSSSILYWDVPRGAEIKGSRAGSRTLKEIEAACRNLEALWPTI